MQRKILLSVAVAAVLGAPAATASWMVGGTLEPDTTWDEGPFMFPNPETSPNQNIGQVYFNAVQHQFTTFVNPNLGATGGNVRTFPHQTFAAYLGVWKDCNDDGYIGHLESVLAEYPSQLLLDTSICPPGTEHNSDGFVYEFFPIGPGDLDASTGDAEDDATYQPHHLKNDTKALVWGDADLPNGAAPGGSCSVNPLPAGATASTGGAISYFDCILAGQITGATQTVDPDGGLGIALDDRPQDDDSLLNVRYPVHPYYDPWNDDTGAFEDTSANERPKDYAFVAWDCSGEATPVADPTGGEIPQNIEDPTGGELSEDGYFYPGLVDDEGNIFYVPAPTADPAANPDASFYDGANQTLGMCEEGADYSVAADPGSGLIEGDGGGVDAAAGRRQTDVYFSFTYPSYVVLLVDHQSFDDNACVFTDVPVAGDVPPECRNIQPANGTIPEDMPYWAGVGIHRTDAFAGGPIWYGLPNYISTPQSVRRDLQPEGADWWTFYAHVGTQVSSNYTLPTGVGTYGSPWCNPVPKPGWDCDPANWYNPQNDANVDPMPTVAVNSDETCDTAEGTQAPNCRNVGVRTGQTYQLRDVDCYDGQLVRGTPAYASLVVLANTCTRPA